MKFFDVFKKKEEVKEKEVKQAPDVKVEEKPKAKPKVKPKVKKSSFAHARATEDKTEDKKATKHRIESKLADKASGKVGVLDIAHCVLKEPHISEKSTDLVEKDQYTFKVWPRANKNEIRKSIEDIYSVDVTDVRIINVPRRKRRMGKITGWKKGYKKAIVKIKKGQKIEVLPR